jgi:formylglycine-generating enzyme
LPTEAEWEFASRGGLERRRFPWGDEEPTDVRAERCDIWLGAFPTHNTLADGFAGTAPVHSFAPNGYGLDNTVGNVWEWCADTFQVRSLKKPAQERNQIARREQRRLANLGPIKALSTRARTRRWINLPIQS